MKFFAVILLAFWLPTLWFQPCKAASALGNETDHLALLKFKKSISHDPYKILASWNDSTHFCNWYGIICSRKHQRVKMLKLDGYSLHGFLSPHIGNLSFLRAIGLRNNSLYGEIPQELDRLFRLQILYLSNNTLTGKIPINLTSCTELRYLAFNDNNLVGSIPIEIGSLHKLEELYLFKNNLSGQIPYSMRNLSSLRIISIGDNNLEGNILEEIGRMENLTILEVGVNKLSGTLLSSLYNFSSLKEFVITSNKFHGSLPANMFLSLPNLQLFEIGENQLSGPIPTSITNASLLQILDVDQNCFVGQVPSLGKLQDLWGMVISQNHLGDNSTKDLEFLNPLANCSKLRILDMSFNNFGGPLPNSLGNLSTQLQRLYLVGNKVFGKIPESIGNLINLSLLNLRLNYLTQIIPTTFEKLQKMQILILGGNKLSGEIPSFICNFSALFYLYLSHNTFEGNIPHGIGNLQRLQYLDLSQNNLNGVIPIGVLSLSSLTLLLNLSQNSLIGTLPVEVGKLKNINKVDVSHNLLFGQIPESIGDCIVIEYLNLRGNSFQETIPSSLASLKGLRYLDLSQNNLSGRIPKRLQDIPMLEYLNVSFNMLDGEVPSKGVFSNTSATYMIGNNKLCGGTPEMQLPPCLVNVLKHKRKNHNFRLIAIVSSLVAVLLLLSFIFSFYHMKKRNKKSSLKLPTINLLSTVSYQSLHNASDGFSVDKLIGSGSFGSVYRGFLESGEDVAIKVLNLQYKGAHKSYIAECNALRNIRHRNLVKVLTCCSSIDHKGHEFKALIFEYMTNGSLEKWLYPDHPRNFLLDQRLNIVINVASALYYLHCECEQPIIHCDLKPSNVLLDGNMVAHVSDFGLARLLPSIKHMSSKQSSTIGLKGTVGYIPPEYGMGSTVSTQGDLYSFGILILEMFTGKKPTDEMFKNGQNLHNYVKDAFPNFFWQIVDPNIFPRDEGVTTNEEENGEIQTLMHPNMEECLASIFKIGLACSVESPDERMSVTNVIRELNQMRNAFPKGSTEVDKIISPK